MEENDLDLSSDDRENLKLVIDDLIDMVVKFNSTKDPSEEDFGELKATLDFANFVVSGIVYSNGIDLCAGHGHDDDDDEGVE